MTKRIVPLIKTKNTAKVLQNMQIHLMKTLFITRKGSNQIDKNENNINK